MSLCSRLIRSLAIPVLTVALGVGGTASAQLGEAAGFQRAMVPDFFRRDIEVFNQVLTLDESQRIILEQMLDDYQSDFEVGTQNMIETFQSMLEDLQGGDQRRIMQIVFDPLKDWYHAKLDLRDDFLMNVHDILLTPQQQAEWPRLERRLRREKELNNGVLSGESADLLLALRTIDPRFVPEAATVSALEEYEIALDEALIQRQKLETQSFDAMTRAIQQDDPDIALTVIDRQLTAHKAVRNVNLNHIGLIANSLPVGTAGYFEQEALRRSFPRIYSDTNVSRMFEAAKKLEGVPEAIIIAITDLEQAYLSELSVMNDGLAQKIMIQEPKTERLRAENYAAKKRGDPMRALPDTMRKEFQKRDEFGETYMRMLQNLLTEDQFASLPGAQRFLRRHDAAQERAQRARQESRQKMERMKNVERGEAIGSDDRSDGAGPGLGNRGPGGGKDRDK